MFSWFYRVWMLENIFQRKIFLLDIDIFHLLFIQVSLVFHPFFNFKPSFSSILQFFHLLLHPGSHSSSQGCIAYNLGTGSGKSVLEMVTAFEKASGKKIPIKLCPRRPGDATAVYASTEKAQKELGRKEKYGITEMCRDQWKWARNNLWGYQSKP
ncbi:hypothetical protein V6Z11_A07G268200 [Gossypium hirsutum]